MDPETLARLTELLAMPDKAWSLGSFGAIAEFMWRADEPSFVGKAGASRVTPRGGIRIAPPGETTLLEYETPSRDPARRRQDLALCLPQAACAMHRRAVVTEIGPDDGALRDEDRGAILFDIGLAQLQVDCHVRTSDPETLRTLRVAEGRSIFDPAASLGSRMPELSPHRVFLSRCGRIEVFQPIPSADGRSPEGPHTHVLPKLLRANRTHAANLPIPEGLVPCLTVHLSHPSRDHAMQLADEGGKP